MKRKTTTAALALTMLQSSLALAGTMGELRDYNPVIGVFGGPAWINMNINASQSYLGNSNDTFMYVNQASSQTTGFVGAFLGIEQSNISDFFFLQLGIEYDYFGQATVSGANYVGIEPATFTSYTYAWNEQNQQVLGDLKILFPMNANFAGIKAFYPYAMVGIGVGINRAYNFSQITQESGSINIAPEFNNQTTSTFTYNLGAGVEIPCSNNFRIGLGYRYSDFGGAALSSAAIVFNQYQQPMPLTLTANKVYANQFIAQLSYVV